MGRILQTVSLPEATIFRLDSSDLVVWNMNGLFFQRYGNFIIPTDFHILQRGSNHQPEILTICRHFSCARSVAGSFVRL